MAPQTRLLNQYTIKLLIGFIALSLPVVELVLSRSTITSIGQPYWYPESHCVNFHANLTRNFHRILTHPLCKPARLTVWISSWFSPSWVASAAPNYS